MSLVSPFGIDFGRDSGDYPGKTEEAYFQDFLKDGPITVERLEPVLREFI